jgi:hypothetical protein
VIRDSLRNPPRIGPMQFLAIGLCLFALKFLVDRVVATLAFGRGWTIYNYLIPLEGIWLAGRSPEDKAFYATMLAVAVPFVLVGIIVTLRRLRDAGLTPVLAGLFFVPAVNLLFFAALSVIPSQRRRRLEPGPVEPVPVEPLPVQPIVTTAELEYGTDQPGPSQRFWSRILPVNTTASAAVAVLLPVPFSIALTIFAVHVMRNYGLGLFVAMPFVLGLVSSLLHGYRTPRTLKQCLNVACLSLLASGAAMIAFAIEGLGCLIMLAPLAFPVAMVGGALGYAIQSRDTGDDGSAIAGTRTLWCVTALAPLLIAGERLGRPAPSVFAVTTSIEIDAPPARVWPHVVSFPPLAPPRDWLFRAGVAYPVHARIDGRGIGARRYCVFSTGAFVEPIEIWDEPRLLRFAVTQNPPPMREWSPFQIAPPHLDDFLVAHRGEFQLIALPDGRTRIEGTTWYEHRLWPESYWRLWSDLIIHRIHRRVLEHVKTLAERSEGSGALAAQP